MARPYIFGIGWAKSGGHSLAAALQMLGLEAVHLGHDEQAGGTLKQKIRDNKEAGREVLDGIDGMEALVDSPVWQYFDQIADQNPAAKFIFTHRPPSEIAWSWCRMIHKQAEPEGVIGARDYGAAKSSVEKHFDKVCQKLLCRRDKLLLLDMSDPPAYKWQQLCRFLGKQLPANVETFPHEFDHKSY